MRCDAQSRVDDDHGDGGAGALVLAEARRAGLASAALGGGAAQLTLVEDPAAIGADGAFHLVGNPRPLP